MIVRFCVPVKPRGQGRPRFYNGRACKTAADREYENCIMLAYKRQEGKLCFVDCPVTVTVLATKAVPASWTKKKQLEAKGKPWDTKPDADNIAKAVLDSLNRVAWSDDCRVTDLVVVKRWGAYDELDITIEGDDGHDDQG